MKKAISTAAALAASLTAFGIAASQAWVAEYVSNFVSRTSAEVRAGTTVAESNGVCLAVANAGTTDEVRLVVEAASDAALRATNCAPAAVSLGVTNGTLFVWNGAGAYVNPAGAVSCTATNLVFGGVGSSTAADGLERFAGLFDVYGVLVQPSASFAVTNGMKEAAR